MQLVRWCNRISKNAHVKSDLLYKVCTLSEKIVELFLQFQCSSRKDVLPLCRHFQDQYSYSKGDVMCHVTRYCNVIGLAQYSAAGHGLYQYTPLFCSSRSGLWNCSSPYMNSQWTISCTVTHCAERVWDSAGAQVICTWKKEWPMQFSSSPAGFFSALGPLRQQHQRQLCQLQRSEPQQPHSSPRVPADIHGGLSTRWRRHSCMHLVGFVQLTIHQKRLEASNFLCPPPTECWLCGVADSYSWASLECIRGGWQLVISDARDRAISVHNHTGCHCGPQ